MQDTVPMETQVAEQLLEAAKIDVSKQERKALLEMDESASQRREEYQGVKRKVADTAEFGAGEKGIMAGEGPGRNEAATPSDPTKKHCPEIKSASEASTPAANAKQEPQQHPAKGQQEPEQPPKIKQEPQQPPKIKQGPQQPPKIKQEPKSPGKITQEPVQPPVRKCQQRTQQPLMAKIKQEPPDLPPSQPLTGASPADVSHVAAFNQVRAEPKPGQSQKPDPLAPELPKSPTKPVSGKGPAESSANSKATVAKGKVCPASRQVKGASGVHGDEKMKPKLLADQVAMSPTEQAKMAKGSEEKEDEGEEKPKRGRPRSKATAKSAAKAKAKAKSKGCNGKRPMDEDGSQETHYYTPKKKKPAKKTPTPPPMKSMKKEPSKEDNKAKKNAKKGKKTKEEERKALLSRKSCAYKRVRLIMTKEGRSMDEILKAARQATCPH